HPDEVGAERPRCRPARGPRRAGEEPDHLDPCVPEDLGAEPGHEADDRRDRALHGEVLRPGRTAWPVRGHHLHGIRAGRRFAEILRRGRRLRDRFEVRDPRPRRPGGARLRASGRGGELPRDPGVRPRRRQWGPLRPERRPRLRRRHPALPARPPVESLVADAGSTDGTQELARAKGAIVLEGERKGPGEGRNRGARAARGDLLVFVDADCIVPRDLIEAIVAAADASDVVGGATGFVPAQGTLAERALFLLANGYQRALTLWGYPHNAGFCFFFRRSPFESLGGIRAELLLHDPP